MKTKLIISVIVVFLIAFLGSIVVKSKVKNQNLISPNFVSFFNKTQQPSPATLGEAENINPPAEFKFDSNTNLKGELDTINPQVAEDDFQALDQIIGSLR